MAHIRHGFVLENHQKCLINVECGMLLGRFGVGEAEPYNDPVRIQESTRSSSSEDCPENKKKVVMCANAQRSTNKLKCEICCPS